MLRPILRAANKSRIMTLAFSEKGFDSGSYSAYRPTYGKALFDDLFDYHRGGRDVAVDIGCGTGQITTTLADSFTKVYGFDTSAKMLEVATRHDSVVYQEGPAEEIPLGDESVDLVTVGQAAHWFNHPVWFKEMARILKRNGTLSFWSYNEAIFTDHEEATQLWNHYSHGPLGPYWSQPGRGILENAMQGVEPPTTSFKEIERHYTAQHGSKTPSPVAKRMPLDGAEAYFRTSSAFHGWQVANPSRQSRGEGGEGDVMDELMDKIKEVTGWTGSTVVNVHWPTIAVLARKI